MAYTGNSFTLHVNGREGSGQVRQSNGRKGQRLFVTLPGGVGTLKLGPKGVAALIAQLQAGAAVMAATKAASSATRR